MTKRTSPEEIERHAENVREQIAGTAEEIRDRLSPGQLFDEVTRYLKHSDGAASLSNLQAQARDNPMALALVGTGLAWLMFGSGSRGSSSNRRHIRQPARAASPLRTSEPRMNKDSETSASGQESASKMYKEAESAISDTYHDARRGAAALGSRVSDAGHDRGAGRGVDCFLTFHLSLQVGIHWLPIGMLFGFHG